MNCGKCKCGSRVEIRVLKKRFVVTFVRQVEATKGDVACNCGISHNAPIHTNEIKRDWRGRFLTLNNAVRMRYSGLCSFQHREGSVSTLRKVFRIRSRLFGSLKTSDKCSVQISGLIYGSWKYRYSLGFQ